MNEEDVKKFETLAEMMFSPNKTMREQAQQQLSIFKSAEAASKLQQIFQKTRNPHALFFICAQLKELFTNNWNSFTKKQVIETRNFMLNFVGQNGLGLSDFALKEALQLIGRITKLSWLEEPSNKELHDQIKKYFIFTGNPNLALIGLKVFNNIIAEMNTLTSKRGLSQHRKIAVSFRDNSLKNMFEAALQILKDISKNWTNANEKLCIDALQIVLNTFKFDYVGIFPDESTDDVGTVQIPATWRPIFEEPETVQLFWTLYCMTQDEKIQTMILQIMVLLSNVRRSLFAGDEERKAYLTRFMTGMEYILNNNFGLGNQDTYHEFCRLLARLKSNFQLSEFVSSPNYAKWIELVAKFSITSFKSWQFSSPSVYYILNLWSRLIASQPYLRSEQPSLLEKYIPEICNQFVLSRLELASAVVQDSSIDNPLENEQNLEEQLDSIPQLVHSNYANTSTVFQQNIENLVLQYQECIRTRSTNSRLNEMESKLSWLIYMIGAVIGKRYVSSNTTDESEKIDAELCARVLRCIQCINDRIQAISNSHTDDFFQRLESSVLYFMKNFKKIYLGDSMVTHPKLFARLKEMVNLGDQLAVLNIFVTKIATNLKIWANSKNIIRETLILYDDISAGYSSAKLAAKLETTQYILRSHSADNFPFMNIYDNMRLRTLFYKILCKLLFLQNISEEQFLAFMKPIESVSARLNQLSADQFRQPTVQLVLIGHLRDLRGICEGCNAKKTYLMFFDWFYPTYMPLLMKITKVWCDTPKVMIPLLKFLSELVYNNGSRISFGNYSANGILLFKETSKLLVEFGRGLVQNSSPGNNPKDMYAERYKPIMIAVDVLSKSLSAEYCNFGVFQLYNDRCLLDVLDVIVKLSIAIPLRDILSYPKLCKIYYSFMDTLFTNHIETVILFETNIFLKLVASLEDGIQVEDNSISSQVCSALDNILTFYHRHTIKNSKNAEIMKRHIQQNKNLFPRILAKLFNMVLFEECSNQYSVSRTMLSLIVTNQTFFQELKNQIIASLPSGEKQQKLSEAFEKLMSDVEMNLESKNRDKYTVNLVSFRADIKSFL